MSSPLAGPMCAPRLLCAALGISFGLISPLRAETVAHLPDRAVSAEELDAAGGAQLAEAAQQLYALRARTLYRLLSDEVLSREAKQQKVSVEALVQAQVPVREIAAADVERLLKSRPGIDPRDETTRKQATEYLRTKERADARRTYVAQLFEKYQVRIALAPPPPTPAEELRGASGPALGPDSAPVTVAVFSDYRCPYCRQFSSTLDELHERYPQEVRIIYRHFPLHAESDRLAQAALCAADQGRFSEYHHRLFESEQAPDPEAIATQLELDRAAFTSCLQSAVHAARVAADRQEGERLQISGTPTVFINGVRLRGAQSLDRLSAAVQTALKNPVRLSAGQPHGQK